jgi:glc operon protein GlcG
MRQKPQLTLDDAYRMVEAARKEAAKRKLEGTIAIVDVSGSLLYLERPDRQSPNSVEVATMKARTAAFRERPSSALEARVKEQPGWLMFPNGLAMGGGVPLFHDGECVGAIAVSGMAHDDEPVAQAGAVALGTERHKS